MIYSQEVQEKLDEINLTLMLIGVEFDHLSTKESADYSRIRKELDRVKYELGEFN